MLLFYPLISERRLYDQIIPVYALSKLRKENLQLSQGIFFSANLPNQKGACNLSIKFIENLQYIFSVALVALYKVRHNKIRTWIRLKEDFFERLFIFLFLLLVSKTFSANYFQTWNYSRIMKSITRSIDFPQMSTKRL